MPQKMVAKVPVIKLDIAILPPTDTHKYLGVLITSNDYDDLDIKRHRSSIYVRGNMSIRKFRQLFSWGIVFPCEQTPKPPLFTQYVWPTTTVSDSLCILKKTVVCLLNIRKFYFDCFNFIRIKLVFGLLEKIKSIANIHLSTLRNTLHFNYSISQSKR